jgi:hypothetical protein
MAERSPNKMKASDRLDLWDQKTTVVKFKCKKTQTKPRRGEARFDGRGWQGRNQWAAMPATEMGAEVTPVPGWMGSRWSKKK